VLLVVWSVVTITAMVLPVFPDSSFVGRGFDKVIHTSMFTALGVFAQAALPWVSLAFTVPMAAGLELMQKRIPRRTFDRVELVANVIGVLLGAACLEVGARLRRA
jgi:hypothetical protein